MQVGSQLSEPMGRGLRSLKGGYGRGGLSLLHGLFWAFPGIAPPKRSMKHRTSTTTNPRRDVPALAALLLSGLMSGLGFAGQPVRGWLGKASGNEPFGGLSCFLLGGSHFLGLLNGNHGGTPGFGAPMPIF